MSLTVWANHELRPGARELLYDSLARLGCRVLQSEQSSRSVLTEGGLDPLMAEADVAYGQPDPADLLGYGAIGRRLTELLKPFHCRVIGLRRAFRGNECIEIVTEEELATMVPLAHHVVNLLPDSLLTRQFCNAAFFQKMAKGARFYNV